MCVCVYHCVLLSLQGESDDIDEATVQGLFASNYETRVSPHHLTSCGGSNLELATTW